MKPKVKKVVDWFLEYSDGTTYMVASMIVFAYVGVSIISA